MNQPEREIQTMERTQGTLGCLVDEFSSQHKQAPSDSSNTPAKKDECPPRQEEVRATANSDTVWSWKIGGAAAATVPVALISLTVLRDDLARSVVYGGNPAPIIIVVGFTVLAFALGGLRSRSQNARDDAIRRKYQSK